MTGRTPFEHEHGEHFTSKEELEVYWSRTMKGLWVGKEEGWRKFMSRELESLLKKMLEPNADVRMTAEEVMRDSYWTSSAGSSSLVVRAFTDCDLQVIKYQSVYLQP